MQKWKYLFGALVIGAALGGCGGGDSPVAPAEAPATPAAPTVTPSNYAGTISFGDTILITMNAPSADNVKLTFVDSAFGLNGTIIGTLSAPAVDGSFIVSNLVPDSANPTPAKLTDKLAGVKLTLRLGDDGLTGEISGLPNLLGTGVGAGALAGSIAAGKVGTAPVALSSLAGVYNALTVFSAYDEITGKSMSPVSASVATLRLDGDGMVRLCTGEDVATCPTPQLGKLTLADQTRFPGAYDLVMESTYFRGRLIPVPNGGLRFDMVYHDAPSSTMFTGTWTLQPVKALAASELDGQWTCSRTNVAIGGDGFPVSDGTLVTEQLVIGGSKLTAQKEAVTLPLIVNENAGIKLDGWAVAMNAELGAAPDPAAPPPVLHLHALLKTGSNAASWLTIANGLPVAGTCRRQ
ncbi:hypothetical protein [Cupriavidus pauculus]|uniref:Uncharacterized protein n=1 Tax=Cupriavidus pauculus TaxID=82633 RepID=A0A2N5CBE1_9BURK|nr:hypothetical protein [Cupriavidus pauculus]PLP99535.1 hypothetical protein CYJ10_17160 [Cupriavidus pauculus]